MAQVGCHQGSCEENLAKDECTGHLEARPSLEEHKSPGEHFNSRSRVGLTVAQGLWARTCISTSVARKVKISWSSRILRSNCWISLCLAEISFRACRVTCVSFRIWGDRQELEMSQGNQHLVQKFS